MRWAAVLLAVLFWSPARAQTEVRDEELPDRPVIGLRGALAPAAASPLETAKAWIAGGGGAALGFPAKLDLARDAAMQGEEDTPVGRVLSLAPALEGVPFLEGLIMFRFGADGALVAVNGRWTDVAGAERGALDPSRATLQALAEIESEVPGAALSGDGAVEEVLEREPDGRLHHHYRVDLTVGSPPQERRVVLSANGTVLAHSVSHQSAAPDALVFPEYPATRIDLVELEDVEVPKARLLPGGGERREWAIDGEHFTSTTMWPFAAQSPDGHFTATPYGVRDPVDIDQDRLPSAAFLEANAYHHLTRARRKAIELGMVERVPKPPKKRRPMRFEVYLLPADPLDDVHNDNAYYAPRDRAIYFAMINLRHRLPAYDASVIAHEYGHHVHRVVKPNYDHGGTDAQWMESRAVSEGWADFFASVLTGSPQIAVLHNYRAMRTAANSAAEYDYDQCTPCHDKTRPSTKHPAKREIHEAGNVISGALWEIAHAVPQLGMDGTAKLALTGMKLAKPPVSLKRLALAMLEADQAAGGQHQDALRSVFVARKLVKAPK